MTVASFAAPIILVLVYGGVAIGRIPGLRHRPRRHRPRRRRGLMVASGALPLEDAYKAVDLGTRSRCCSA